MAAPVAGPWTRTEAWSGFHGQSWRENIDVRQFVQDNYTPYEGGAKFLAGFRRAG